MDPCIGEYIAFMTSVSFSLQGFSGFNEIIQSAGTECQVITVYLIDAPWDPVYNYGFCPGVPQRTVDTVRFCIDYIKSFRLRRLLNLYNQVGRRCQIAFLHLKLKNIFSCITECCTGLKFPRVCEYNIPRSRFFTPPYIFYRCHRFYLPREICFPGRHNRSVGAC